MSEETGRITFAVAGHIETVRDLGALRSRLGDLVGVSDPLCEGTGWCIETPASWFGTGCSWVHGARKPLVRSRRNGLAGSQGQSRLLVGPGVRKPPSARLLTRRAGFHRGIGPLVGW